MLLSNRRLQVLYFALLIKPGTAYVGKSPEFANFVRFSEREQKWPHSCTNVLHKNPHSLNRDMLSEAYHPANFMTQGGRFASNTDLSVD